LAFWISFPCRKPSAFYWGSDYCHGVQSLFIGAIMYNLDVKEIPTSAEQQNRVRNSHWKAILIYNNARDWFFISRNFLEISAFLKVDNPLFSARRPYHCPNSWRREGYSVTVIDMYLFLLQVCCQQILPGITEIRRSGGMGILFRRPPQCFFPSSCHPTRHRSRFIR